MAKMLYNREHLVAHEDDWDVSLDGALAAAKRALFHGTTKSSRTGYCRKVVQKQRVFGRTGLTATVEAIWGYRAGRKLPSRFSRAATERELVAGIVVVGVWLDPERFKLFTLYPGNLISPLELADKKLWESEESEIAYAVAFWQQFAFTPEQMAAALPEEESAAIEAALQNADYDLLKELLIAN